MDQRDVILLVLFLGALLAGFLLGWWARGLNAQKHREAAVRAAVDLERQATAQERLHRANRLRDNGRVTDVHPEASGPPSRTARVRVLGMQPDGRDRPPTRM